ncbi:hypothetical protein CVP04_02265 [Caviibacterium pharyngocola]|uniref:Uncharacterized protein n=1 Tax=Caviibacterium pharyngocola TaxID=28159 RepID=A0A2M8RYH2_9PAST|nr:hypothetical protein CVP04_02265 [Caviibacterium pharyngocola]
MLLIKNPRIFHNIAIKLIDESRNSLNAILFSLNNKIPTFGIFSYLQQPVRHLNSSFSTENL